MKQFFDVIGIVGLILIALWVVISINIVEGKATATGKLEAIETRMKRVCAEHGGVKESMAIERFVDDINGAGSETGWIVVVCERNNVIVKLDIFPEERNNWE